MKSTPSPTKKTAKKTNRNTTTDGSGIDSSDEKEQILEIPSPLRDMEKRYGGEENYRRSEVIAILLAGTFGLVGIGGIAQFYAGYFGRGIIAMLCFAILFFPLHSLLICGISAGNFSDLLLGIPGGFLFLDLVAAMSPFYCENNILVFYDSLDYRFYILVSLSYFVQILYVKNLVYRRILYAKLGPYKTYLKKILDNKSGMIVDYTLGEAIKKNPTQIFFWIGLGEHYRPKIREIYEHHENVPLENYDSKHMIRVEDRDDKKNAVLLTRLPHTERLKIPLDTFQIETQIKAIDRLMEGPAPLPRYPPPMDELDQIYLAIHAHLYIIKILLRGGPHAPLINLFRRRVDVRWKKIRRIPVTDWFLLTDLSRDGVSEQREFVEKALSTPDFAFLNGPPGSGKTTVLCELVHQLLSRKKRILICSSTNVAVDNLLERLVENPPEELHAIRVGKEDVISEHVKKSNLIKKSYELKLDPDIPHYTLKGYVASNFDLVCGTTYTLQSVLPEIDMVENKFDVMIIDEASKTTFREFLIPALYASRWVLVGDIHQLTPYVDNKDVKSGMDSCIDKKTGDICLDVFDMARRSRNKDKKGNDLPDGVLLMTESEGDGNKVREEYNTQCVERGVDFIDLDNAKDPLTRGVDPGKVIAGSTHSLTRLIPKDALAGKNKEDAEKATKTRIRIRDFYPESSETSTSESEQDLVGFEKWRVAYSAESQQVVKTWGDEVALRITMQDHVNILGNLDKGDWGIGELLPSKELDGGSAMESVEIAKMVALPSILQIIQHGFKTDPKYTDVYKDTPLRNGIPKKTLASRLTSLTFQHRMHKDIADFSHVHIYNKKSLATPESMDAKRQWGYDRYKRRLEWIPVWSQKQSAAEAEVNFDEAQCIVDELEEFCKYAMQPSNLRSDGKLWTVAILSFYKKQNIVIQNEMKRLFAKYPGLKIGGTPVYIHPPCTADSFQGQEADLVFLSLVKGYDNAFLNNPHRINVAITRARYQCVIVGNRENMQRKKFKTLSALTKVESSVTSRRGQKSRSWKNPRRNKGRKDGFKGQDHNIS